MERLRRASAFLTVGLTVIAAAIVGIADAGPAGAESTSTSCAGVPGKSFGSTGWPNQCWMINDTNVTGSGFDRETWVLDPGVGNFLTRDQLIAHAGDYDRLGFSDRFLW